MHHVVVAEAADFGEPETVLSTWGGRGQRRAATAEELVLCRARPYTRGNFRIFSLLARVAREKS
jgi:hypothetical protein